MSSRMEKLREVLDEAKVVITRQPSFEAISEWNRKLDDVCPPRSEINSSDETELFDMFYEWNFFCIKIRQFIVSEEK